jgi:hypothetical protein
VLSSSIERLCGIIERRRSSPEVARTARAGGRIAVSEVSLRHDGPVQAGPDPVPEILTSRAKIVLLSRQPANR